MTRRFLSLLLVAALGACSLAGEIEAPKTDADGWWQGQGAASAPAADWWREFGDETLNKLVDTAFRNNTGYQAAAARLRQAEAQVAIAGASLLPSIDLGASGQVAKKASATGTTGSSAATMSVPRGAVRSYQIAPAASYELDFWGKNLNSRRSAAAALAAKRFDSQTVAITLAADVATTWFQMLALDDRVEVAKRNLDLSRQSLTLFERQESFGKISALDAAQQRSTVALTEAKIPAMELQRRQAVTALSVLTGLSPVEIEKGRKGLDGLKMPEVAAGLPSEVLERRPDIAKAMEELKASQADIGVARAQLFPSFTLTAERGYSSAYLVSLLDPKNMFWSLGTSISANIFDNGKLRGNVRLSEAKRDELIASYRAAVLAALKDVSDALDSQRLMADQEMSDMVAAESAREAWRLASIRYREGAADYLSVLQAQSNLLEAEDGAVQARQARLNASVSLFRALAGSAAVP